MLNTGCCHNIECRLNPGALITKYVQSTRYGSIGRIVTLHHSGKEGDGIEGFSSESEATFEHHLSLARNYYINEGCKGELIYNRTAKGYAFMLADSPTARIILNDTATDLI